MLNIHQRNIYKYYFCLLIIFIFSISGNCEPIKIYTFDSELNPDYLPYTAVQVQELTLRYENSFPVHNPFQVMEKNITGKNQGKLLVASNPSSTNSGNSRFTPRTFPEFVNWDDDPIKYTITGWLYKYDSLTSQPYAIGVCHTIDTLFVFKLNTESDSIIYKILYINQDKSKQLLIPSAVLVDISNFNKENRNEIFIYVGSRRFMRRLYCFDFDNLEKKWEREISSGIQIGSTFPIRDSSGASFIFITGNSANGLKDTLYNDRFSFLSKINKRGIVTSNQLIGEYGHGSPLMTRSQNDSLFYLIHYFLPDDSSKSDENYFLSKLDKNGIFKKTVPIESTPAGSWIIYNEKDKKDELFVLFKSRVLRVFDRDLNEIYIFDTLATSTSYLGKIKIPEERDSVLIFSNGLYNQNFKKILHFPEVTSTIYPIECDTLGNVTAFIIGTANKAIIYRIKKKTYLDLASVLYHQNQLYFMMFLSALFAILIATNYYRRKSKYNLILISNQKKQIEISHKELIETQKKLIKAEKYKQAKDIAGGFAHEIRNSLFPAESAISRIKKNGKYLSYTDLKNSADNIKNSLTKAIDLTSLISQYTKIENNYIPETVNISKLMVDLVESNKYVTDDKKITVTTNISPDIFVTCNTQQLYIVLNNLLINSIDSLNNLSGGLITIYAKTGKEISIIFNDNGCGINENELDKIFNPFYSTKPTTGNGIGLSICQKIIELYNGTIEVKSDVGLGTTFTITLPKRPEQ